MNNKIVGGIDAGGWDSPEPVLAPGTIFSPTARGFVKRAGLCAESRDVAIGLSTYPGFPLGIPPHDTSDQAKVTPEEVTPDEVSLEEKWADGWTDAELRTLATDIDPPLEATGVDRSGTPGVRWRRVVCWLKGHYPVEIWSSERHHHTECGRCPRRWAPDDAPLAAESQIV